LPQPSAPRLEPRDLRPAYLTGARLYMRALLLDDKAHAAAWHPSPFPINAARAEEYIKNVHKGESPRTFQFVIARLENDEIVGGLKLWTTFRVGNLTFQMAPWLPDADELRAEALGIAVRWLRDDFELMTISVSLPADAPHSLAAAEQAGLRQNARLREALARPGGRVDELMFEALNPRWISADSARNTEATDGA
jgi:RimJ/RimL family protein N-acetyltransferase